MNIDFFKKKQFLYGAVVTILLLCVIAVIVNIVITNNIAKQIDAKIASASQTEAHICAAAPDSEVIYRLYECGGKIGIYDAKTDILIDVVDVFVSTLPSGDQKALKKGIDVYTFSELAKIIDDFSS